MWLVEFRYLFSKNCSWDLYTAKNMHKIFSYGCFLKVFFTLKCIKIFFLKKNIFEINSLKYLKIQKKKLISSKEKKLSFKKNTFKTQN